MPAVKQKKFDPERMTREQAAEYTGLAVSTLDSWRSQRREGSPPYLKLGGRIFYRQSTLDKWIAENTVETI